MKVVITGSSGFIGSHLTQALKKIRGIDIVPFDRSVHSLFDPKSMQSLFEGSQIVFHLSGANRAAPHEVMRVNVIGTLNVLEAMRQTTSSDIRLIFLSSFQVYRPTSERIVIDEFFPLEPETLYGISKKMAEDLIGFYGFPSIIFRPSNIYGPKCRPYYNSVISTFCDLIVKGDTLTLNGTGEQKRDFLYVEDVVDVLLKAMEYEVKGVQAFNLCSGKLTTLNEVIETLKIISGKEIRIIRTPILEDNCCIKGNNEKAKRMLNWSPQVGLREGLEHTYMWFKRGNR